MFVPRASVQSAIIGERAFSTHQRIVDASQSGHGARMRVVGLDPRLFNFQHRFIASFSEANA